MKMSKKRVFTDRSAIWKKSSKSSIDGRKGFDNLEDALDEAYTCFGPNICEKVYLFEDATTGATFSMTINNGNLVFTNATGQTATVNLTFA
jgi:hypothetical protein